MVTQSVNLRSQETLQKNAEMNLPVRVESKLYHKQTRDMKVVTNKSFCDQHIIRRSQVLGQVP